MFIEGIMDKEYFEALKAAGHDVVWECHSAEDLVEHGYKDHTYDPNDTDIVARIFIDCDVEDIITPAQLLNDVDVLDLPKYLAFNHAGLKGEISARLGEDVVAFLQEP